MQLTCPTCKCVYVAEQADGLCPRCLAAMAVRQSDGPVNEMPIDPGETFHGLLVQKLVARGGMGILYRARQPISNRDVALKILPRSLAVEEEFRLRFDREARALAGLNHPNIVNLYDYGIEGDLMFLVMEFVEGVSLRQSLRDKLLPAERALRIAIDVCEALQFAHREGIIHRDIKPENVLVDRAGRVKLTDFGLAKRVDSDSTQLTQTSLAVGTPHYMAPEQLESPTTIDHRVDIYSVGVLLYEMLTRELPIGRFPAPSSKSGVDERLDDIIYRCLEKNPNDRYQTVAELKKALASATGQSHEAPLPLADDRPTPSRPKVSNVEVACACGWQFFVPAAARGLVHCPSCGEPVPLNTPVPGTRRVTPAPPRLLAPKRLIAAAGALTVLVGFFLFLVLGPLASRPDPQVSVAPRKLPPLEDPPKLPAVKPPPRDPVRQPPPDGPPFNSAEARHEIKAFATQANMAGLVATILLYSGRPGDHEMLQGRIRQLDGEIKERILRLEENGLPLDPPERFRGGDKIVAFGSRRADLLRTLAFADELRAWLRAFRPGASESLTVTRNRLSLTFPVEFPERTPELVALAHQVGIALGETPGTVPDRPDHPPPPTAAIPVAILNDVRRRLEALPLFYRRSLPYDDRGRAEALLVAERGTSEDTLFLTGRFSDLLRRCEAEPPTLADKVKELETRIADPASITDTVVCKDGRRLEGTILEQTATHVKLKGRLGTFALNREEILRIEKGKGAAAEWRAAYEAARGQKAELLQLLALAKDRKLTVQAELAATAVLVIDPADERCRAEIGMGRSPFSGAPEPDPVLAADRIEYRGRLYTPDQLRQELKSLGYVQLNGLWCEKVARSFKIDNLYRDEAKLPVTYTAGVSVRAQTQTNQDTAYDYKTKSWVPRTKLVTLARYIGGSGQCHIEIAAPGDLIDCRVRARSQVATVGGFVAVSVVLDPSEKSGRTLFTLSAPGENDTSYDVTDRVAGRSGFHVRAEVRADGMFLISDPTDLGVFEVKYTYGKPLERINAIFQSRRESPGETGSEIKSNNDSIESGCRNFASNLTQVPTLVDALSEMKKLTEWMHYARDFVMPSRFADVAAQLKDPLFPDWNSLTREQAFRLGSWWGVLPLEERRDFLTAYGVWCARTRYLKNQK